MLSSLIKVKAHRQPYTSHEIRLRAGIDRRAERERAGDAAHRRRRGKNLSRDGGARADGEQLRRALEQLQPGDVPTVTRLDRLARSTRDLLNTLDQIAKRGAGFKSLADTWADTTTAHGRLLLTVLGGLAEFERDLIRSRTGQGTRYRQGREEMGRKAKLTSHQQREAIRRRDNGEETLAEIGRSYAAIM